MRRLLWHLVIVLAACGPAPRSGDAVAPGAGDPRSVRPGVNAGYYDDGALGTWIDRFEGERREVVAFQSQILAALALEPGMVVADIGAGTGLYFEMLARDVGPKGKVYATDIVPVFLDRLRVRARDAGLENVEVVAATTLDPKLPTSSLDLVFLCDVYHHIEYPAEYMSALLGSLEPGGELVLIDFERIEGTTSKRMLAHIRAPKETVVEELQAAGFEFVGEVELGLEENYFLRLRRPP